MECDRTLTKTMALIATRAVILVAQGAPPDDAIILATIQESKGDMAIFQAIEQVFDEISEDFKAVADGTAVPFPQVLTE